MFSKISRQLLFSKVLDSWVLQVTFYTWLGSKVLQRKYLSFFTKNHDDTVFDIYQRGVLFSKRAVFQISMSYWFKYIASRNRFSKTGSVCMCSCLYCTSVVRYISKASFNMKYLLNTQTHISCREKNGLRRRGHYAIQNWVCTSCYTHLDHDCLDLLLHWHCSLWTVTVIEATGIRPNPGAANYLPSSSRFVWHLIVRQLCTLSTMSACWPFSLISSKYCTKQMVLFRFEALSSSTSLMSWINIIARRHPTGKQEKSRISLISIMTTSWLFFHITGNIGDATSCRLLRVNRLLYAVE